MPNSLRVGVIGAGNISATYLKNIPTFPELQAVAVADMDMARAEARAREYGIEARPVDALLAANDIDLVVNLTVPAAHADISLRAIASGKHVHTEKPLAITPHDGPAVLTAAAQAGLRVGAAPDTFMGAAQQTCRHLIDQGAIGEPVAAVAFMMSRGPEPWHPDPSFFYKPGGGPVLDMAPYYLTALINLFGPVKRVVSMTRASFPERVVGSGPKKGERITVETPTHMAGTVEFASGPIATVIMSFDIATHTLPHIQVYGSEGSLMVPDPNMFDGEVRLRRAGEQEWRPVAHTHPITHNARGVGAADMAGAILAQRPHRASGELAGHVLEVMLGLLRSSDEGKHLDIVSRITRPEPMPAL